VVNTRDRVLSALIARGPSTALELQHATGISATSIRPVLAGAQCEFVGWKGEGRQRQRIFKIKDKR
jgi:hypothetical protein